MEKIKWQVFVLVAISCLLVALFLPAPNFSSITGANLIKDLSVIQKIWNEQVEKYVKLSIPFENFRFNELLFASIIGVGIIFGTDHFVRRFSDSVIKRIFKKNKDSR